MILEAYLLAANLSAAPKADAKVDTPALEYTAGSFFVHAKGKSFRVSTIPSASDEDSARKKEGAEDIDTEMAAPTVYRNNNTFLVWDERGMTLRHGTVSKTLNLDYLLVSPKLLSKEQIQANIALRNSGEIPANSAKRLGSIRIGKNAYFLLGWEDSHKANLMEALVRVPLSGNRFWVEALGRFEGQAWCPNPSQALFIQGHALATIVQREDSWGTATYDIKTQEFGFRSLGAKLSVFHPLPRKLGLFAEHTKYGTTTAGWVNCETGYRRILFEGHGDIAFLEPKRPFVILNKEATLARLIDLESGAELRLRPDSGVQKTPAGILVWQPKASPTWGRLYDPTRWTALAAWPAFGKTKAHTMRTSLDKGKTTDQEPPHKRGKSIRKRKDVLPEPTAVIKRTKRVHKKVRPPSESPNH